MAGVGMAKDFAQLRKEQADFEKKLKHKYRELDSLKERKRQAQKQLDYLQQKQDQISSQTVDLKASAADYDSQMDQINTDLSASDEAKERLEAEMKAAKQLRNRQVMIWLLKTYPELDAMTLEEQQRFFRDRVRPEQVPRLWKLIQQGESSVVLRRFVKNSLVKTAPKGSAGRVEKDDEAPMSMVASFSDLDDSDADTIGEDEAESDDDLDGEVVAGSTPNFLPASSADQASGLRSNLRTKKKKKKSGNNDSGRYRHYQNVLAKGAVQVAIGQTTGSGAISVGNSGDGDVEHNKYLKVKTVAKGHETMRERRKETERQRQMRLRLREQANARINNGAVKQLKNAAATPAAGWSIQDRQRIYINEAENNPIDTLGEAEDAVGLETPFGSREADEDADKYLQKNVEPEVRKKQQAKLDAQKKLAIAQRDQDAMDKAVADAQARAKADEDAQEKRVSEASKEAVAKAEGKFGQVAAVESSRHLASTATDRAQNQAQARSEEAEKKAAVEHDDGSDLEF